MPDETTKKIDPSSKPIMYFHYAGLTDTGQLREHNEDDYKLPLEIDKTSLLEKGHLYVLADGMGGHQKGEVAAAITVQAVPSAYYEQITDLRENNSEEAIIKALSDAIEQANVEVMEATQGGGTTVVTAVLHTDLLVMMNVGDSRAYLLRDNELRLISRDHSLVSRLVEMGKITEEEALTHPRRNVLYQALGQGSELEIHTIVEKLQLNDTLILCSDGLWGEITDEMLKAVLLSAESPHTAVKQLIDIANEAGGPDNITAIIVQITDKEPSEIEVSSKSHPSKVPMLEDTQPSPFIEQQRPNTLPEGKYYTNKR